MRINSDIRKQIENLHMFIHRWNTKAEGYNGSNRDLSAVFDEFITRYIIFNVLYKICAEIYGERGDRNSATKVVEKFLSEHHCNIIPEISPFISRLTEGISEGKFIIGIPKYSDKKLLTDLQNNNILALLECIYQLRCNLFHGDKEFIWRQEQLLSPVTHCLEILNRDIYNILNIIAHEEIY